MSESPSQGNFPQMENIAAYKPISASPSRSTCGLLERSGYCQSAHSHGDLGKCYQAFCVQDCPYRSSTPPFAPLLLRSHRFFTCRTLMQTFKKTIEDCLYWWIVCLNHLLTFKLFYRRNCVTEDRNDTRPGTQAENPSGSSSERIPGESSSVLFQPHPSGCLVSPPSQKLGVMGSLTLAVWIKPSASGEMWVWFKLHKQPFPVVLNRITLEFWTVLSSVCGVNRRWIMFLWGQFYCSS